jgi:hypothetical protein
MKALLFLLLPFSLLAKPVAKNATEAIHFINSLNPQQKAKTVFAFADMSRYDWHFVPPGMHARQGIAIKDLNDAQKKQAYTLLQTFLSQHGYTRTKEIMQYEYLLKELEPNNAGRIPENYFVAIYGNPAVDTAWGWKFSGHHVALNFTIVHDQLAFAPFFFGANPAEVNSGPAKGKRILKEEEDLALELLQSFSEAQKSKAVFRLTAFVDIVTGVTKKVEPLAPAGLLAADMTAAQKILLNKLIVTYLASMPVDIAKKRMQRITAEDMNDLRFGWAGEAGIHLPHYYRIQGKTFLIEFDNTQNNANHIHTVWRDFNGDFGEDLLRQHYEQSPHHHH